MAESERRARAAQARIDKFRQAAAAAGQLDDD
jgi:hypothetical protein